MGHVVQDYQNIANGVYKLPWDMTTSGHHQWNPLWVVQSGFRYIQEAVFTLDRWGSSLVLLSV